VISARDMSRRERRIYDQTGHKGESLDSSPIPPLLKDGRVARPPGSLSRPPLNGSIFGLRRRFPALMMSPLAPVAWSVSAVFMGLSGLHACWAFGGHRGKKAAIPHRDGEPLFQPGPGATLVVALLLGVAAAVVLERAGIGPGILPPIVSHWGAWGVAIVLMARAVGEFRYVGLFKTQRDTSFARMDTRLYSPLALALGVSAGLVAWGGG
jgi:Protein of unknown function (DUF3995)